MGSLISLAIYAALIGAAWIGVNMFLANERAKGADAQLKADAPVIAACKTDLGTVTGANQTLQVDVTRIGKERDDQNRAVADLAKQSAASKAQATAALAAAKAAAVGVDADNATLTAALAAVRTRKGGTCESTLAAIDDNLRSLARVRVREPAPIPAGAADRGPSGNAAAGTNPGRPPVPKP